LSVEDAQDMRHIAEDDTESQTAMRRVFDRHFSPLMRHVRMAYPKISEADAADFVSSGFVRAFEKAASYRGESALRTWMMRIIHNMVLDSYRRKKIVDFISPDENAEAGIAWHGATDDRSNPLEHLLNDQSDDCVRRQFEAFRQKYPQAAYALWARMSEETPLEELAMILEKTYGATRQYLSGWGKKLRTFLEPCLQYVQGMSDV
jgi:RNA polymerase sigma factor (sigma-70 family)